MIFAAFTPISPLAPLKFVERLLFGLVLALSLEFAVFLAVLRAWAPIRERRKFKIFAAYRHGLVAFVAVAGFAATLFRVFKALIIAVLREILQRLLPVLALKKSLKPQKNEIVRVLQPARL